MLTLLLACSQPEAPAPAADPVVVATSFPAWYLADQLLDVPVRCVLPPGADPQTWQPDGDLIAAVASADLIIASGAGFEAWMKTAALPERRIIDLSEPIDLITLEGATHSHGIGGEHSHAGTDPHTWLDPQSFRVQAEHLRAVLSEQGLTPADTGALSEALVGLHADYGAVFPKLPPLYANHPAYNYLARRHGRTIPSIDVDPEVVPEAVPALPEGAVVLWESAPSEAVAAAIPARHVVIDPLEQPADGTYDYLAQSRANITALTALLADIADGDDSHP